MIADEQTKKNVITALMNGEATVVFTKADGTVRKLRGTLNKELMPADVVAKWEEAATAEKTKRVNKDIQHVYDLENNGWRSFRWDSYQFYIMPYEPGMLL